MTKPDAGMFGIKLIGPLHLRYPVFTQLFDGTDGKQTLMNFAIDGAARAAKIPDGHRCFVYVTADRIPWQRFLWAIEIIGDFEAGDAALRAHGMNPGPVGDSPSKWALHRPIRFLARIDSPDNPAGHRDIQGPTREEIERKCGFRWRPYGGGHYYISSHDYERVFAAIDWIWTASDIGRPPPTDALDDDYELETGIPRGHPYHNSKAARKAIELRAMQLAIEHYGKRGWSVNPDVSRNRPYDLACTRGKEELRVEVKGKANGWNVILTRNEVRNAREFPSVALFIVSGIEVRESDGRPVAYGGRHREWNPWNVDEGQLDCIQYEYSPPA